METLPPGWDERRSGMIVPAAADLVRPAVVLEQGTPCVPDVVAPEDALVRARLALAERGLVLGFGALTMIVTAVVVLALIGQPWVAGIMATGLAATVAVFVTGRYRAGPDEIQH